MTQQVPVPRASYSRARENLIKAVPSNLICSLTCGGKECRYEVLNNWTLEQQAIRGLYSTWITDNILAMVRPSTPLIKEYKIIEQFSQCNIKSVINMQIPGEHAHCGSPLEPPSGFSYLPEVFMDNNIFFFNFGMPDFGVSSLIRMLDMVKVMAFAEKEGKVAVHCHAGLGRTGVLIACYLVYAAHVNASEAIHFVRLKRPSSIQTQAQINLVYDFAQFLVSHFVMYASVDNSTYRFTLQQYLIRQKHLLHGDEARKLKNIPKLVHVICKRLIMIALNKTDYSAMQEQMELEAKRKHLTEMIRQTLSRQKPLSAKAMFKDADNFLHPSINSFNFWNENEQLLEQRRGLLWTKRSHSDSDLRKIVLEEKVKNLHSSRIPVTKTNSSSSTMTRWKDTEKLLTQKQGAEKVHEDLKIPSERKMSCQTETVCVGNELKNSSFTKYEANKAPCYKRSVTVMEKSWPDCDSPKSHMSDLSKVVAIAMAADGCIGKEFQRKTRWFQTEMNKPERAWGLLLSETDPKVLSYLLWSWFEQLKEPFLSYADIGLLSSSENKSKHLWALQKCQEETIFCILDCICQITSMPLSSEEAIIFRMIKSFTQCSEKAKQYSRLSGLFKDIIKEKRKLQFTS
ncbi:protein tyrosine phosphatase domain-containing protein 1 [Polypterus senegalus]|uniref:protein tyrosine phosphatase domain-containing protein 1 n=1 Tax=Polypterus senegalus TaxID=55291 RepID=UPI001965D070|nr:protein tyrosine phosphatase domain-containing protein 1 [Polypterus senegalus]